MKEHEAMEDILAGYALHALDPHEQAAAETAISAHLPFCPECRKTLEDFQQIAGDLALAAGSRRPPPKLSSALRRELGPTRWTFARWAGGVAAVAAVLALSAILVWNMHLTGRMNDAEIRQARTTEVLATVTHPASRLVQLSWERPDRQGSLAAAFVPGRQLLYLFGSVSAPPEHHVYQVWLTRDGQFVEAGTFLPDRGLVLLRIDRDPRSYDGMLITEEPVSGSHAPSGNRVGTANF